MRLAFGRYMPGNSILHRLDPRLKLFMIIALMATVFFPLGFSGLAMIGVVSFTLLALTRISFKIVLKLLKPVIFMLFLMFIINIFMVSPNHYEIFKTFSFCSVGNDKSYGYFIKIRGTFLTEKTAYRALYMSLRIFLTIQFATILTGTTQPIELTLAIEDLLSPLKLFKIPVYIFSTIISIALRMIPTLIDEAGRIMKAQSSRGIDFKNGKLSEKSKSITSLIIPLLVSSFQKAEDLAYAMDSRGYNPHGKRTRYRQSNISFEGILFFIFMIAITGFLMSYPFVPIFYNIQIPRIDHILGILN